MSRHVAVSGSPRGLLWLAALVYTAFVIYGSLVPLDFRPLPWDEALAKFTNIPFLKLGIGSRADWVANLILYLPLGFLLMGAITGSKRSAVMWGTGGVLAGLIVAGLALSIEFFQQYFPPRTVSLNDLYAEWVGGALGILLWPLAGRSLSGLGHRFSQGGEQSVRAVLVGYALIYFFLSLFPYDFLLDTDEWRAHLASGKAGWLFADGCGLVCWGKLVPEMLAVVPFGLLLASRASRPSIAATAGMGVLLGLVIEALQLGIASGISQGASILSRSAGVALGACLPGLFTRWNSGRMRHWVHAGLVLAALPYAGGLVWLNRLLVEPWTDTGGALARLAEIRFIPFYYHYYTSEAVALVSLVFQFGLYSPLGAGVWLWNQGAWRKGPGPWLSALLGGGAAFMIESGKLFVPGLHADPTNVLIATAAAGGCHALLSMLFRSPQPARIPRTDAHLPARAETADQMQADHTTKNVLPPSRKLALALLIAVLLSLVGYPSDRVLPLMVLLGALSAACWRWPGGWLIVIPAVLPLLDFSYLTGRLFWSEFDTVLLLVLAIAYARERLRPAMTWPGRLPLAIYVASALIGLFAGMMPLAPFDWNALTHYTSSYHALHAVKGLLFALAFLPLVQSEWHRNSAHFTSRLAIGMSLGLALELLYVLWERVTFSGLLNFDTDYRITGSFPGMHIGGASIEAYLVLAAPFVWLWAWTRERTWTMLVAGGLYALAAYGVMVTFSRGGQAAFMIATLLALAGFGRLIWKARKKSIPGIAVLLISVAVAGMVAWPIISGKFSQSRLEKIQADIGTRTAHWQDALDILSQAGNPVTGAGAGTFPAAFYWYSSAPARPASYVFAWEGDNVFLRLGGGESLYFEQIVPLKPGRTYRLLVDVRTSAESAALTVPVCEKAMLYSFTCDWNTLKLSSGNGQWQRNEIRIRTDRFGPPGSAFQRPVKLSMFNQNSKTLIDVDNVTLLGDGMDNLVRNGDFSKGMQSWFFSTDSHLAWHAKNLFIHVLFEQGWLGLGAFAMVLVVAGVSLLRRAGHDALALTLFVSLAACHVVGLVDSIIDEPRLGFLFFWLLMIALVSGGKVLPPRRRSRSHHAGKSDSGFVVKSE